MPPGPKTPFRIFAALAAVLCAALLSGCGSTKYTMRLEADAEKVDFGKSYVILPGIMETRAEDPQFKAVAAALDKMLQAKGYTRATGVDAADLGIYVEFGVKETIGPPMSGGAFAAPSMPGFGHPFGLFGAGGMERVFSRWLTVEAVDFARYKANDPKNVVWSVSVTSRGSTASLEKAMPFFAAAMDAYIGRKAHVTLEVDSQANVTEVSFPQKHHRSRFPQ
ncbi:DUF4136 domain-containing protein [Fundidesulfovibrio agrisoli]|uniref:DUF4136 domain-containing protein n=1 Tax=Fundidesulfovibrio agrisoli TaxID=2922717 RepID=UPI001FACF99C|nr:DUF4136 domain-containing protein [Fundidesulfovibrio agrisoli]